MAKSTSTNKLLQNQVFRFVLSAGAGFLVDVSAFYLFYHNLLVQHTYRILGFTFRNYTVSLALSFFMGVVVNFLITRYMVFNESKSAPQKQFFRFATVATVGFFANLTVVKVLIQACNFNPTVARVSAALSLFFASFFIHKVFSFSLSLKRNHANGQHNQPGN
ncbi:GtrA family protein [Mucilaginibacter celer]|uniref:GtrA family protein n=1 Tax=Mucilaginibacter celer TaxID=2305508 RepID=A0A494VQQ0_9SPHI|nr:GtrA family protein [Mucilaginibacter celer]AYL95610.1 GtrA family protein [Mucilaginibacter celer]